LRTALRAGNIWVEGSRRYADPESYLIPKSDWREQRAEIAAFLGTPLEATARLDAHKQTLRERLTHLDRALTRQDKIRLEDGAVVVSPLEAADLPPSTQLLTEQVTARLPRLELADLLVEVDGWTHFSDAFVHAAGTEARTPTTQSHLYAVLLGGACNLGLHEMEHITEFSVDELAWCANWYVREETLRPAMVQLVNYQHHQPLAQAWGGGTLSSSDGQRFPVDVPARHARHLVRYFPVKEQGVTFYSWSGDQWPQYGSKLTPVTGRDAPWVLDEILDNETELPIQEHTTDTSGYTEMVFGLFDLLNLQFAPRIRDLPDQQLYSLPGVIPPPGIAPLFHGTIQVPLIVEQWDELLRLAGSLKLGWVAASLMLNKLQTVPRKNRLARALQEYGRLVKTLFILRYLTHEDYRRRIETQLNKGEGLHALRRFLFLGNWGRLRKGQPEEHALQALMLTLVTNAVVVWNTRYMAAVLDTLRAEGYAVREEDLSHLSPARHTHINPHGKYRFNLDEELSRQELRPLRRTKSRAPQLVAESAPE
jgi:TnpA family transposase